MTTLIALLRGVNVGGRNRVPMAELRGACMKAGWSHVMTYIQSGNIVLRGDAKAATVEQQLEQLVQRRFKLTIPVLVRAAKAWSAIARGNPFLAESAAAPNLVMLALSKAKPKSDVAEALQQRATAGERIVRVRDAIWIHFVRGMGTSKLTPAVLDRLAGSPVTTRNWRTVEKLEEMAAALAEPGRR